MGGPMILVTGDVVLDYNVYVGKRPSPSSSEEAGSNFVRRAGGAALTYEVLQSLTPGEVVFGIEGTDPQQLEKWHTRFHSGALWEPVKGRWRLTRNLGYGSWLGDANLAYPATPSARLGELRPRVLVIDDGALGIRHATAASCWPGVLTCESDTELQWIVL